MERKIHLRADEVVHMLDDWNILMAPGSSEWQVQRF